MVRHAELWISLKITSRHVTGVHHYTSFPEQLFLSNYLNVRLLGVPMLV